MFRCVSYNFGALATVWLSYETRCKTSRTGAKVDATKSRRNFSQRTHPIHPIGPFKNVLVHFINFWCIWDRLVDLQNSMQNGPNWCKSSCHEVASKFFAMNAPDPPHWTLNSCFGAFVQFGAFGTIWLTYETRCETGRTGTKVRGTKSHRNFSKQTHPIHPIGP